MQNEMIAADSREISAMTRDPEAVLAEARDAAKSLSNVIQKKNKPVVFNGEQYLEFEDWQTLGKFYSLAAQTEDAMPVEIDGIKGAKARAIVVDVRSGAIIGRAEAYCLRDERNWKDKPWFQLASMAQTRAGAKALRNVLSWVVVLAGYKTTPAEEMQDVFHAAPAGASVTKKNEQTVQSGSELFEIRSRLAEMNKGDEAEMDQHLRQITHYVKDGKEISVGLADLESISKNKPKWFTVIRAKVSDQYHTFKGDK